MIRWIDGLGNTYLKNTGKAAFLNLGLAPEVRPEVRTFIPGVGQGGCQDHGENYYASKQHQHNLIFLLIIQAEFF